MSASQKQLKLIFYASIVMDLVAVAIVIAVSNIIVGVAVAAALLAGEYVVYRVLIRGGTAVEKPPAEEKEKDV